MTTTSSGSCTARQRPRAASPSRKTATPTARRGWTARCPRTNGQRSCRVSPRSWNAWEALNGCRSGTRGWMRSWALPGTRPPRRPRPATRSWRARPGPTGSRAGPRGPSGWRRTRTTRGSSSPARRPPARPVSRYALYRTAPSDRAVWTSVGLDGDGALLAGKSAQMTLDVDAAGGARAVNITIQAVGGATKPVRWRVTRGERPVAEGRLRPGQTREVRLPVPACESDGGCPPVTWTLRASGPPVWLPFPAFGAPGPVRPLLLLVTTARFGPGG